jgi:hypothetical protein
LVVCWDDCELDCWLYGLFWLPDWVAVVLVDDCDGFCDDELLLDCVLELDCWLDELLWVFDDELDEEVDDELELDDELDELVEVLGDWLPDC